MPKRKQGEVDNEGVQDFELIELLIRETGAASSTSTQQGNDFESFKARFQSYVDQVPSYLHSVGKEGFFPHFFLGSFSTLIDTEIATKLNIEKIYFSFDSSKTLKVAVIKNEEIKSPEDVADKVKLFVIAESGSTKKKFSYGELDKILGNTKVARNNIVRLARDQGKLGVRLVEITKEKDAKGKMAGISVNVENNKLDNDASTIHEFKEIKKGVWNKPENDITKLTNPDVEKVKKPVENILKKVSGIHSEYKDSLTYAQGTREAAHHGFVAGALVNFRYRHNLRVYLEQFAGRGYADIVLVPRGKDRSLNAVPIIIELKAGTAAGTTPGSALEQAKDYAKGFQPNTMRVLTISDNVLCVGLNLDSTEGEKFSMHISPREDREIALPTMQALLKEASDWNGREEAITDITEKIKQPLERIYHTFPGTPEKGGNYFSRFLLGQLLLADKFVDIDLEKSVFLYNEYPLASSTRSGAQSTERPVTTFMLTKGNQGQDKEVFIFHIREGGKGEFSEKKIPINLTTVSKITEVCISLQEERKSDFFDVEKVNRYNSLNEYRQGKSFFDGEWKNIPYPAGLKETFDEVLKSQLASSQDQSQSIGKYKELFGKLGETVLPFKVLIEKEAHTQAISHGAFSHYSDIKLGELQENRALVLTEFQTGRGKRIDMLVHGIKFADQASSAKEYDPVGLELKGPREGKTADALKDEANKQIADEYKKGVTYKTLTDGKKVDFIGVVFDKGANNADSLILMSKDAFTPVKVVHSSIFSISQQQCFKGRRTRSIGIPCIDSFDEEKITEEEKKQRVKKLFDIDNAKDLTNEIIDIGREQVFDMIGNADRTDVYVKVKDNNGNDKKLIIGDIIEMKNAERYFVDDYSDGIEILVKVGRDKDRVIKEKIKGQNIEYYLSIDGYEVKFDDIIKNFTTDAEREKIHNKLHQLSNDKQLLENKKYIEDIGDVQDVGTNQDYNDIVKEIKQNLLAKGVREDTFDRFKSHFDDLGEKVFADYISNVESSLKEKGIAFDRDKFDSTKIKGAKGGKFFSMMAIYDLLDSIGDTATLGRHNNDALKQVFGINGILDAMDDVRTSVSISPSSKVGKLIGKIPGPARQAFVKVISNPVVQSITFATIAYQFGYSINEIAQGNHHPLNYYWTASSGVKLTSMSIRPVSAGVSFAVKSVSTATKILRGLSAAGKVLGRMSVFTMVPDIVFSLHQSLYSRTMEAQAIAAQIPISNIDRTKIFFSNSEKVIYEDYIRIKGYLNTVKSNAINYLNSDPNIAAVVQYVTSIEEKYSEIIQTVEKKLACMGSGIGCQDQWVCGLEKRYESISFNKVNTTSNVKDDLSSLNISRPLDLEFYQLDDIGATRFKSTKKYEEFLAKQEKKKVYLISKEAKYLPHITQDEYNSGLRVVMVPSGHLIPQHQCSGIINEQRIFRPYALDKVYMPCNAGKTYRNCQESFTLSGEPFIFTSPTRKDPSNTKKQTFPKGSVLYISGPKTLTAAANYPAVMYIPDGNVNYVGSKNKETIFVIGNSISGTLEGGVGKENTVVMNVKANNIVADLYSGTIHYGNSNNIALVNTHNYVSNSDNRQNITTNCKTTLINVKNAEIWQNSFNCTDKDYEVRVVNKENVHHRGLKQTVFIINKNSDSARIVSDLGSTGKIKGNIDVISVQVANITQWGISEDIEKVGYSLDLLANNTQSIVSSTKIDDFKNLIIQVNCSGVTESVAIQDKSLFDTAEDIRYQKLKNSGNDISGEVIQNSEKKLKAFIQASIIDQELFDTYQIAKGIADNNNFDIPVSQIEVIKNHMGIPSEKVIIACMYSGQVIVDFSYNNSDVTSSYQKYQDNRGSYDYAHYMILCNYYQDVTVEGREGQHQYIIKLPDTLNSEVSSSPIRINLKIKNKAAPYQSMSYNIIDFAELNVTDVDSISIQKGKRSYTNECYNQSISDLTEDSLEIKDITVLGSEGTRWSLSVGLVDYFQSPEHQQIVLQMNNKLYKIDSTNLKLEHVEMDPNSFRYYQPDEQGLQIYHNQPIDKNEVGLVDFRDKSILGFDMEIADDSLVLSYGNSTIAKVENWSNYQPAREMMFAFNDTMVSNLKCIVSACNSEGIIVEFNQKKVILLKEEMFDAIVQNGTNEANDLIRKIETIEGKSGLIPLYVAIQAGRLDIVEILFERKHFSVKDKDIHPLHWAAQQGNLNIARFLVDKGADIGVKDNDGRTPLRVAAYSGNLDMVKFFLDRNMSIEVKNNDPYKMMGVVEGVKNEIINQADTAPNVKRWAEFFVEKLRYSIKSVAKEKLKDGMLHNRYSSVNELANEIYKSDGKLFDDIIKGVINDVYGRVDTKETLSYVRSHNNAGQLISGYVAVFDAIQRNDDLNNSAIFKLAYSIKEAMSFDKYSSLDSGRKSELERLKNKLPESVRNAVFSSKVCIKNIYQNEYLYAANSCFNYDSNRRRVFTWISKGALTDKFKWKIKLDGDNFNIVNAEFNENLYAASDYFNYDNDRRMVFTWVSGGGVARDVWMIKPDGNNCSIMNVKLKEHLYAADYAKYDNDRRRVFTWIPGGQVSQGMWMIEDCGSTLRKVRNADASSNLIVSRQVQLDYALLNATKIGNISEVTGLVNQGANVNTEDRDGNTPARNAVLKGHFGIIKYLVEKGVSLKAEDHYCGPPTCNAAHSGHLNILKYLISKCVDINDTDKNGWTPLHFAAWRGYLEVANFLIEKGADINAENIFGRKPIHIAAENNNKDIIDFFLSKGMSIDDTGRDGRTLLYLASRNGHLDLVRYLVDKGADVYTQDKGGKTLLDIATDQKHNNIVEYLKQVQLDKELLIAVQYGNLSKVEDLVSQGASLSAKYSDGRTLMHCAAYGGELNVVKYLVVGEKSSLKIKDNSGRIPLHYAAYNGKLDIVKYFIDEEKIDVNIKDHGGWAPLYYASCGGYSNVINYLGKIHNSDLISNLQENSTSLEIPNSNNIEVQDKLGRTPLHLAAKAGDLSKINLLCDDYNANIEAQDNFGYTPIFFATQSGKLNVVSLVLYYGANINAQDMYGSTPLHYAAQEGNLGMIQLLLSRCARIELLDRNNWTPILFAARESKWSAVELLVSKGAKFNNEITYQGTPLHFAVQEGNLGMVKFLIDQGANIESQDDYNKKPLHLAVRVNRLDIVKFLLDKHANIEARDMDGDIPLELAIQSGYKDIEEVLRQAQLDLDKELLNAAKSGDLDKVKECIKRGAYINTKSNNGRTSLHWAAFEGCLPGVEYLIKEVADINAKDNTSRTPLHYAARNGHLDVVKYLIEEGADFEVKDKDDKTPLDLASWKKHNDVVKYLEKIKEERDKTVQRKRRHHHGDHARHHMSRKPLAIDSSNQPEIAASGSTRPSSWINDLFGWVKSSIGGLLSSKPVGISSTKDSISQVDGQFAKASVSNSSPTSTTLSSDGTDKKQESNYFTSGGFSRDNIDYVNANIKQMRERQTPVKFKPSGGNTILEMGDHYLSHVDFNGTIMLLDLLIRKVTGQKYISTVDQSISPLEAQGYALNITKEFEKVVEQAGLKSGVSMYRLNIDFVEIQKEVTGKIMSGKFNEISGILSSYVEKACLGEEAGKLSPKKFEKFIAQFDKGLLNQSIEQILHNRDGRLEVDDAKQMSLEPQSYLSNASVHSHSEVSTCLSEIGVTKLGGNLNR